MWNSVILLVVLVVACNAASKYCDIDENHTMCLYSGRNDSCPHLKVLPVDDAQITAILAAHNKYRDWVASGSEKFGRPGPQPGASNMVKMQWDAELAEVAQRWADQCTVDHDASRGLERFQVGQNIYYTLSADPDTIPEWSRAVESWYDEVREVDNALVQAFSYDNLPNIGHYTQMIWGTSRYVGCGLSHFVNGEWNQKLYVCNYGPAGNWLGDNMYKTGEACFSCPGGSKCDEKYRHLCAFQ